MELRKALIRVAKIIPKKKDHPLKLIRFLSDPPRVVGTNGTVIVVVNVDEDLPSVLVGSDLVLKAAKDAKELGVHSVGYGDVELRTGNNTYKIQAVDAEFPEIPLEPEAKLETTYWDHVKGVVHAAAKEDVYGHVNFTPNYVEAFDTARLARARIHNKWSGLLPVDLFKAWPKGDIEFAFTEQYAFFRVEDELRIAAKSFAQFPDFSEFIPDTHPGSRVLVNKKVFLNAVKQGTEVSQLGFIKIEFSEHEAAVRAWQEGDVGESFYAVVPFDHKWEVTPGSVLVNGKYLGQALKAIGAPNVILGFGDIRSPLRVEGDKHVECLWQLV